MPGPALDELTPRLLPLPIYGSLKTRLQGGHQVTLLESGLEYVPALVRAIDDARECIFVETYIYNDDAVGRRVAHALARASQRGVDVHLVVDGFGTPRIGGESALALASAAIHLEYFRPESARLRFDRRRLRRLHRKLVVVDGRIAFVGGINLLDDLVDPNHGSLDQPRFDFAVQVRGPLVAHANVAVHRLWHELALVNASLRRSARHRLREPAPAEAVSRRTAPARRVLSEITHCGHVRAQFAVRDNLRHRRTIERWYLRRIARARFDITIANAYFLPGVRFRRALTMAAARGVRVRLLLQGRVEYRLQHYATQALYDELLSAGIQIIEYRSSFLHAKVAAIDNHATVGSSNIDPFSLMLAREANVFVHDEAFASLLRSRIDRAIDRDGEPVVLERHRQRRWFRRLLDICAFALLRLAVSIGGPGERY